jgi:hypothetical protein
MRNRRETKRKGPESISDEMINQKNEQQKKQDRILVRAESHCWANMCVQMVNKIFSNAFQNLRRRTKYMEQGR